VRLVEVLLRLIIDEGGGGGDAEERLILVSEDEKTKRNELEDLLDANRLLLE